MEVMLLMNPFTHEVSAELTPKKEVVIRDKLMLERLKTSGITVSRQFMRDYKINNSRLYPPAADAPAAEKSMFAIAFEKFYFADGPQQKGYFWKDKKVHEIQTNLSDTELADIVLGRKPCPWILANI